MSKLQIGGGKTTKIEGAVIKEQNVTFAVVVVKDNVITQSNEEKNKLILGLGRCFPGMQIVLAGKNSNKNIAYYGRKDLTKFLSNLHPSQIPWKEYTFDD